MLVIQLLLNFGWTFLAAKEVVFLFSNQPVRSISKQIKDEMQHLFSVC